MTEVIAYVGVAVLFVVVMVRWPGFCAGLIAGLWYVLPVLAPGFAGYFTTLGILSISATISFFRFRRFRKSGGFEIALAYFIFVGAILFREWTGGDHRTTWAAVGIAVTTGALITFVGSFDRNRQTVVWGFAIGNSVFAIGEIARVLNGGELHASYAAFDANPIFAAQLLGVSCISLLTLWVQKRSRGLITFPMLLLLGGALVVTLSRGPILALVISLLFVVLFRQQAKTRASLVGRVLTIVTSVPLAVLAFIYLQNARDTAGDSLSAEVREDHWASSWETIIRSPIFGSGTDGLYVGTSLEKQSPSIYPHNIFLEAWGTYGLLPFLVFVTALFATFVTLNTYGRACLIFIVICYCASGTLTVSISFWVGVALSIVIGRASDNTNAQASDLSPEVAPDQAFPSGRRDTAPKLTPQVKM